MRRRAVWRIVAKESMFLCIEQVVVSFEKASENKISPTRSCARSFRHDNICMGGGVWDNNMAVEMGVERRGKIEWVRP